MCRHHWQKSFASEFVGTTSSVAEFDLVIYFSKKCTVMYCNCSTPATAQHWMMANGAVMSLQNKHTYYNLWPFLPPVSARESRGPAKPIERQSNERE